MEVVITMKYIIDINSIPCQAIQFGQVNSFRFIDGDDTTATAFVLLLSNKTELIQFLKTTVSFECTTIFYSNLWGLFILTFFSAYEK